jgi:hypothetical protein
VTSLAHLHSAGQAARLDLANRLEDPGAGLGLDDDAVEDTDRNGRQEQKRMAGAMLEPRPVDGGKDALERR